MVLAVTVEEKISKLHEFKHWHSFTPTQQKFLEGMARGMQAVDAYADAWPDCKALLPQTAQMLCRAGIKNALASIEIDTRKPVVSRIEAVELLSGQLRKRDIDPVLMLKIMNVLAKLQGWDKPKEPQEGEEVGLDMLVAAVEKKRKRGNSNEQ